MNSFRSSLTINSLANSMCKVKLDTFKSPVQLQYPVILDPHVLYVMGII